MTRFVSAIKGLPNLEKLHLSMHPGNFLTDSDIHILLNGLMDCSTLLDLSLSSFGLHDRHAESLGKILCSNVIKKIDFSYNDLSDYGLELLLSYICCRREKLLSLNLLDCRIVENNSATICKVRQQPSILST